MEGNLNLTSTKTLTTEQLEITSNESKDVLNENFSENDQSQPRNEPENEQTRK